MTSKSLFCKLVRDKVRRNLWALALSVLGFLFAGPLRVVIYFQENWTVKWLADQELETVRQNLINRLPSILSDELACAGLMIMALLCGITLFRFLHDRRQVDFYFALPIRRETLFGVSFVTGVLLVLPAYFVMKFASAAVAAAGIAGIGMSVPFPWGEFFLSMGIDLLAFFTIYSIAILCTTLCGNTAFSSVLALWALSSPFIAGMVYEVYAMSFYPTYSNNSLSASPWLLSPAYGLMIVERSCDEGLPYRMYLLCYVLVAAAALALSFVLMRRWRGECAGKAVAFGPLRLPLKLYTCIVVGLAFGCLFSTLFGYSSIGWMLLCTAVGAAVCHCVMEVIYNADTRAMFRQLPMLVVTVAAALGLSLGLSADMFGYTDWLPKEGQLEWVELHNLYLYDGVNTYSLPNYYNFSAEEQLTDPEVVEAMLGLARLGIENQDLKDTSTTRLDDQPEKLDSHMEAIIHYRLKGERHVFREYTIPRTEEALALLNTVIYSEDYLKFHNNAIIFGAEIDQKLQENPDWEPFVQVDDVMRSSTLKMLHEEGQVRKLLEAMRADVLDFTPAQAAEEGAVFQLYFGYKTGAARDFQNGVSVYPSYRRTLALLEEYAGIVPTPLDVDEVTRVQIEDRHDIYDRNGGEVYTGMTTNREEIAQLLPGLVSEYNIDRYGLATDPYYRVRVLLTNGNMTDLVYLEGAVPQALAEELCRNRPQAEGIR
ncbi:MAG: hypothetical protein HFH28_00810 [Clostridiaceae bacterium]|nr:hypothetical protein [Clostridiaceae bacterium]